MPTIEGCAAPPRELSAAANQAMAPVLAEALIYSHASASQVGTWAIPVAVRDILKTHYSQEELDRVRWTVADHRINVANLVVGKGTRYKAMTVGAVIVFEDEAAAQSIELWAHELVHARQFRAAGGIRNFARIYLSRWPALEQEAVRRTNMVLSDLEVSWRQNQPSLRRCPSRA